MSLVHYQFVGHIDPRDPIEFGRPSRPKVSRPIDPRAVSRVLKSLPNSDDRFVDVADNGCVYVATSVDHSWDFLTSLANETGAIVLDQYLQLQYPDSAKAAYEGNLDDLMRRWQEFCRDHRRPESM
jgi:hypothetical protein